MSNVIAIQSWCYREFKALPAFFEALKAAGVSATELCGVHAKFTEPATWNDTLAAFKAAGVTIAAIGVEGMSGDVAKDRVKFDFLKAAGVKNMSISFGPDLLDNNLAGLKNVDALIAEYGVKVGIHNHGGYDWLGNDTILRYIFKHTKNVGLHMDTAWAIDAKQNPVKWAEQFADRLTALHVKDFLYSEKREPRDVVIGTGILDLPALMAQLKKNNFAGPIVIEYEGDAANPVPALSECVNKLKALV
jgi:inosose dehydratase